MAQDKPSYYVLLGVTAAATKPEIDRAYLALKASGKLSPESIWNLERAYVSLSDPNLKRKYDAELKFAADTTSLRQPSSANSPNRAPVRLDPEARAKRARQLRAVALSLTVALIAVLWLQVWPILAWRFRTYQTSTALVEAASGKPFGTVMNYEPSHMFGNRQTAPAYQIRFADGTELWLSKAEVNQLAKLSP